MGECYRMHGVDSIRAQGDDSVRGMRIETAGECSRGVVICYWFIEGLVDW